LEKPKLDDNNELGGKKFGGSIIYPPKEKLIDIVFNNKQLSQT